MRNQSNCGEYKHDDLDELRIKPEEKIKIDSSQLFHKVQYLHKRDESEEFR